MSGGNPLGWTVSHLRAVHTRAAGIMDELQERKDNHLMGADAYARKEWQRWEDHSQKNYKKALPYDYTRYLDYWPKEWTPEQQKALEDVTAVVRQLDQYATVKKQRFGGVVV